MKSRKYSNKIKKSANNLRKDGKSYQEIARELGLPKSTVKLWTCSVKLSDKQKSHLYSKQISLITSGKYGSRERREKELEKIINESVLEIKPIMEGDSLKLIGAAIYWAEGDKTKQFALSNSDPALILFFVRWLKMILNIKPNQIKAYLNIHHEQNKNELIKFWSKLTGIPEINFGKPYVKPKNIHSNKKKIYYGTIKIVVPKGSDSRHRLYGWVKAMLDNVLRAPHIKLEMWK